MAGHIFISHGSENRDQANELTRYIEARGLRAWIAPRDVRPGVDYSEALQEAIEQCGAFIVLVTDKANRSPYVRVETEMAFSLEKPIFPVRTSEVKPGPGLALFLKIRHWTDAYGPHREESLDRLARELEAVVATSAPDGAGSTEEAQAAPTPVAPPPAAQPAPAAPAAGAAGSGPAAGHGLSRGLMLGIAAAVLVAGLLAFLALRPASGPPAAAPAQPQPTPPQQAQPQQQGLDQPPAEDGTIYYTPPDPADEPPQEPPPETYDPPQ